MAWWREQALAAMDEAAAAGRLPILCGGTGLYFLSLTRGLSEVPAVPAWAREEARARLAALGAAGLHEVLARADPATAAGLRPTDAQRIARAFEVLLGTGRGLAAWQQDGGVEACRLALLRDPVAAAAAGASRRGVRAVRRHVAGRRPGGGEGAARASPRSGPAGHARAWRAGACGPSFGPHGAGRSADAGRWRTPASTSSARTRGFGTMPWLRPAGCDISMRESATARNFRQVCAPKSWHSFRRRVDAAQHGG